MFLTYYISAWKIDFSKGNCWEGCGGKRGGSCHNRFCGYNGYCCSKHYYILPSQKEKNGNCDTSMRKDMWKQTEALTHMCLRREEDWSKKSNYFDHIFTIYGPYLVWKIDKSKPDCYDYCGKKGGECSAYCGPGGYCCSKHYYIFAKHKNGDCSKSIRKDLWKQTASLSHKCVKLV